MALHGSRINRWEFSLNLVGLYYLFENEIEVHWEDWKCKKVSGEDRSVTKKQDLSSPEISFTKTTRTEGLKIRLRYFFIERFSREGGKRALVVGSLVKKMLLDSENQCLFLWVVVHRGGDGAYMSQCHWKTSATTWKELLLTFNFFRTHFFVLNIISGADVGRPQR